MKLKSYYLGLDIGTDSVGYAVTDEQYQLIKFHGEPAWGATVFDEASLNGERRSFRTARRRLDRRQQRVKLIQELFSPEVEKVDPRFFIRQQESYLYRDEVNDKHILFNDVDYTDIDFFNQYPTIHHLICDLMNSKDEHDVRLVYLACAWLVAHRGHFLSNIDVDNIDKIKDFTGLYKEFLGFFEDAGYEYPWEIDDPAQFGDILKAKMRITDKSKQLASFLYGGKKPSKEATEIFPYNRDAIVKLLAGGTCKLKDLFCNIDYDEFGSVSLTMDDEKLAAISDNIGEDFELIANLKMLTDWAILVDALDDEDSISEAKTKIYDQHKADLALLKRIVRKYLPEKYDEVFRNNIKSNNNYVSYSYHTNNGNTAGIKKVNLDDFSKYLKSLLKDIVPEPEDQEVIRDMEERIELLQFMPKQKNTDNRVIPYQLYAYELKKILKNASEYLGFLNTVDEDGISVSDKIYQVFTFKTPYFVGPLNAKSEYAWLERKAGKIYPWNFESMVDLDASEQNFIKRMTNQCTYLPGEPVLPKDSLIYRKFMTLNEINNIKINGEKISVELKQDIYNNLFSNLKKVTRKRLVNYLIANGIIQKGEEELVSGIDVDIKSSLASQIAFKRLMESGLLSEQDVETIIERASYAEDKTRLSKWLEKHYPQINDSDRRYICRIKINDFGRLSGRFLCDLEGVCKETGEIVTIIGEMWNTSNNLMEILSDKYTFSEEIEKYQKDYYSVHPRNLSDRLDEMYISNSVKRSIYRTLAIVKDVEKAFGKPQKIFVEMARGGTEEQKGKRTKSRKEQIYELYSHCKNEDVRELQEQLESMGEYADNKLQSDRLFLYYMQLGRCMYSGTPIELEQLSSKRYDVDHIYPQAYVKDDSIINNKVLVLSKENGKKGDVYPISSDVRDKMSGFWHMLKDKNLISQEKYNRLVRSTAFTDDEKQGFINRQLTETSQATKAIAVILKERFPDAEIVYCKARLVTDFRNEFDLYKSRSYNDLHHAVDAYLNIVTGNVYSMKFTRKWFNIHSKYSIKAKTLFTHPLVCEGKTVWDGEPMLGMVKKTASKNNAHFTKYAYLKRGGFFDQQPVAAAKGLVPLKRGLDTEKYGGYNKAGVMFFIPVKYTTKKKSEIIIMSVEMLYGKRFLKDKDFAETYTFRRLENILGKKIDEVSFPLALKPWKINTVLSLNGYKVSLAGIGGGGKCLIAQPMTQFTDRPFWNFYLKKLERFDEKCGKYKSFKYSQEHDQISPEENLALYDLYINKYTNTIMKYRVNNPIKTLENGRDTFMKLDIDQQTKVLLNIHRTFARNSTGGVDLQLIGGAGKAAATVNFSSTVSNWKKNYTDVRVIDSSVSGLWSKVSDFNFLELK